MADYSNGTWGEGRVVNGVNVGGGAFTPNPTPAPTPTYSRLPETKSAITAPTSDVPQATPVDEVTIRNNEIAKRESEFGSINSMYDEQIKSMTEKEQKAGDKDLARANTISAMTGMAGGVDATSRAGGVERNTKDIIQKQTDLINSQRGREIAGIYDKIDANVQREKELEISTAKENRAAKVTEMNHAATANIMAFANQGIEWNKASTDPEFMAEVKRTGQDPVALQKEYEVMRAAKNVQQTNFTTKIDGGKVVSSWVDFDPATGKHTPKFETHDIPGGGSYSHSHFDATSGKLVVWDDNGNSKTIPLAGSTNNPKDTRTTDQKNEENNALNWMRTQSDYKQEYEKAFSSDPVIKAKVIAAYKAANPKKSGTAGTQTP